MSDAKNEVNPSKNIKSASPWDKLPLDLQGRVLGDLSLFEATQLSVVSTSFKKAVDNQWHNEQKKHKKYEAKKKEQADEKREEAEYVEEKYVEGKNTVNPYLETETDVKGHRKVFVHIDGKRADVILLQTLVDEGIVVPMMMSRRRRCNGAEFKKLWLGYFRKEKKAHADFLTLQYHLSCDWMGNLDYRFQMHRWLQNRPEHAQRILNDQFLHALFEREDPTQLQRGNGGNIADWIRRFPLIGLTIFFFTLWTVVAIFIYPLLEGARGHTRHKAVGPFLLAIVAILMPLHLLISAFSKDIGECWEDVFVAVDSCLYYGAFNWREFWGFSKQQPWTYLNFREKRTLANIAEGSPAAEKRWASRMYMKMLGAYFVTFSVLTVFYLMAFEMLPLVISVGLAWFLVAVALYASISLIGGMIVMIPKIRAQIPDDVLPERLDPLDQKRQQQVEAKETSSDGYDRKHSAPPNAPSSISDGISESQSLMNPNSLGVSFSSSFFANEKPPLPPGPRPTVFDSVLLTEDPKAKIEPKFDN